MPNPGSVARAGPALGVALVLVLVLVLGAVLRLAGLYWGLPDEAHPNYTYHPDETALLVWAQSLSEGNFFPRQFIFGGTFFSSVLNGCIALAEWLPGFLGGFNLLGDAVLAARLLGVASSWLTVLLVYATGRRLFGRNVGLLAALLLALAPAHVVLSATARPDALATLFGTLFMVLAARVLCGEARDDRREFLLTGLVLGVTVALRFPIAAFAVAPVLAYGFRAPPGTAAELKRAAGLLGLTGLMAIAAYLAASPHSLLYGSVLLAGLRTTWQYESSVFVDAVGRGPVFWQYGGRILAEALGAPLHALALASVAYLALRGQRAHRLLLLSAAPYFVLMVLASWVVVRYTLPLLPWLVLLIAAAAFLFLEQRPRWRAAVTVGLAAACLWTLAHDAAFLRVMRGPDPRDRASAWIRDSAPAEAGVVTFEFYDGDVYFNPVIDPARHYVFPLRGGVDPRALMDDPAAGTLVVHENLYGNLDRLRDRHPSAETQALGAVLDSGRYVLAAEFRNVASFLGVDFSNRYTALDYRVIYPGIRVYRRVDPAPGPVKPAAPAR